MKKALSAIVLVVLALALMGQVGVTIGDVTGITRLPAIDSVAADDEIAISDTSGGDLNRATITQLSTTIVSEGLGFTDLDTDYGNETITSDFDFGGGTLQVPNSATLPGTCEVGDTYMDTDATSGQRWYLCESADSWVSQSQISGFTDLDTDYGNETVTSDFDFGGGTVQVPNSTSLPGTCEVGDSYMDTDATSGSRWYLCESANNWVAQTATGCPSTNYTFLDGEGDCENVGQRLQAYQAWHPDDFSSAVVTGIAAPTLSTEAGTNVTVSKLVYPDANDACKGVQLNVPENVTSSAGVRFSIYSYPAADNAGSLAVRWVLKYYDLADAGLWDTALTDEVQLDSGYSAQTARVEEESWSETLSDLGWSAGNYVTLFLCRDPDHADDDLGQDVNLLSFSMTFFFV